VNHTELSFSILVFCLLCRAGQVLQVFVLEAEIQEIDHEFPNRMKKEEEDAERVGIEGKERERAHGT
jgi:hypothetical protein